MNLEDIRVAVGEFGILTSNSPNLGPYVPKSHMRHIFALKYDAISGAPSGTSGVGVSVYDQWGTSNSPIDNQSFVSLSGSQPLNITWPSSPRPDFPIGHVKESGVCAVFTSGIGFTVTMVYTDRPGGTF